MTLDSVHKNLEALGGLNLNLLYSDFLLTWQKTHDEILATTLVAECLHALYREEKSLRIFDTGLATAIFRDKSTRTRFSFSSAANALGLSVAELDEEKSQIVHGETVRETAVMISFLTEVIGIRDDLYLGEGNRYMREVAAALDEGSLTDVIPQRPTIVNLQCDIDHPTQSLADLLKLKEHFGSFEALKGKRMVMSWAHSPSYGKPLSVPQGIIGLLTRFGMDVVLAAPEGYDLTPEIESLAEENARSSGGSFSKVTSMDEAFNEADVVYPKSWAPFNIMEKRTELLKEGDREGLERLEKECLSNNAKFVDWECDEKRMKTTRGGDALYMHCLPADISGVSCEKGEVAKNVFEKYRLGTYREAGYKPFVIAAMILLAKVYNPSEVIARMAEHEGPRHLF